ncbi:MAG TPA: hypothetical protein VKM94_12450 [Blastocatellia bacterium]|nr:hypothetical protein [Blastocatellia bacterium]
MDHRLANKSLIAARYIGPLDRLCLAMFAMMLLFGVVTTAAAQQPPEPPVPVDPTPLIELLPPAEKTAVGQSKDPKKLIFVLLNISDSHLDLAYSAIKGSDTRTSEKQLDIYNKAAAEATGLALSLSQKDGRRALSKQIEQRLYKQIRTLELIERMFPPERLPFATAALKNAKQLRVHALNAALAAGDMLKDPDEIDKKPESESPIKNESGQNDAGRSDGTQWLFPSRVRDRPLTSVSRGFTVRVSYQLPGDYLTEEEDDHVRQAQSPDERTKVFMKIADRRITLITGPPTPLPATSGKDAKDTKQDKKSQKKAEEEEREWGTLPSLSHTDLLRHYARAIDECVAKLEDAYERNPKAAALMRALTILRDSTERQLARLHPLASSITDDAETKALATAIDSAESANKGARDGLSKK